MTNNERISANNEELRGILDTVQDLPDAGGGYDEGYEAGLIAGQEEGYNSGYEEGFARGSEESYEEGYRYGLEEGEAAGKRAEHDAFWDAIQNFGNETQYSYKFMGAGWTDEAFKPKYDITPAGVYQTFYGCKITDLKGILDSQGVKLDTSKATNCTYGFSGSTITRIPTLDCRKMTSFSFPFTNCNNLTYIEKLILPDGFDLGSSLSGLSALTSITIEGTIGANCNVMYTPLSHDSLMSIISALKDYSGTGTTRTVTLGATNLAKLTDAEKAIATQKGWTLA